MHYETLYQYGLTACVLQEALAYDGCFLARVIRQHRDLYRIAGEQGDMTAAISGRLMRELQQGAGYPAVGDWVMTDRENDAEGNAVILAVLPRKSAFTRKSAGSANEMQTVAANVDTVFLCMALNEDYNLRRLERYLTVAWDSGATLVIVLTKADLCADLPQKMDEIALIGMGADIVACSVVTDPDCAALRGRIRSGETAAFLGSSGVGKSTLINRLLGREALVTREIGADGKGRHTTTHRELFLLPGGGIVIDTPGMRELQLFTGDIGKSFGDIEELAQSCRFRDCTHRDEPGCNVKRAVEEGLLQASRLESYHKLQRELQYEGLDSRQLEKEKITRMMGGLNAYKQARREFKDKR